MSLAAAAAIDTGFLGSWQLIAFMSFSRFCWYQSWRLIIHAETPTAPLAHSHMYYVPVMSLAISTFVARRHAD